jgi:outer membrane cobalamin receptor
MILLLFFFLSFPLFCEDTDWDDVLIFTENEGIVITGTIQTSQQMAVIDREEIERQNAKDIASLLQETLDLNIVSYGAYGNQTGINLRGFDSKRVAFLIDGIPANSSMDGKFDIYQINMNSVERIEVIYGGSDSKFNVSGALGGVINIVTVKKQDTGWRFDAAVSNTSSLPGKYRGRDGKTQSPNWEDLFDTQNYALSAAYGGEKTSVTAGLFANRAQNHFLFTDFAEYTRRKDNNEVWDTGINASFVRNLSGYSKLLASTKVYYGSRNFPTSGFSDNVGNQNNFSARQTLMLDSPRAFHDTLATELSLSWNFDRLDYTPPAGESSRHDQQSISLINRWNWYPVQRLTLGSGIDYRVVFFNSTEIGSKVRQDGGVYLTAEWQALEWILLTPSIKAVFSGGKAALMPKLGVLLNVTDSLAIRNNYFRSFKFPDFEELYWSGGGGYGNPDLLPEDGLGADLGLTWRITELIRLESVFFGQWLKNSIHWYQGSTGVWQPENVGDAVFLGLENKVSYEIPVNGRLERISISVSYQYLRSYLLSFGYDFSSDKRIPYNPEHTIGGSLDIFWKTGSLLISGHYEGIRFHDRENLTVLKPYFLLNATVNKTITKNIHTFGSLKNILNQSYESFYGYPMPGISLTLGMRFNLKI